MNQGGIPHYLATKAMIERNFCSVAHCPFRGDPNRSYHKLPDQGDPGRKLWLGAVDIRERKPHGKTQRGIQICSSHFHPEDFDDPRPRWKAGKKSGHPIRLLKSEAVPSIRVKFNENAPITKRKHGSDDEETEPTHRTDTLDAIIRRREYERAAEKVHDLMSELETCLKDSDGIRPYDRVAQENTLNAPPEEDDSAQLLAWQLDRISKLEMREKELEKTCIKQKEIILKFIRLMNLD